MISARLQSAFNDDNKIHEWKEKSYKKKKNCTAIKKKIQKGRLGMGIGSEINGETSKYSQYSS